MDNPEELSSGYEFADWQPEGRDRRKREYERFAFEPIQAHPNSPEIRLSIEDDRFVIYGLTTSARSRLAVDQNLTGAAQRVHQVVGGGSIDFHRVTDDFNGLFDRPDHKDLLKMVANLEVSDEYTTMVFQDGAGPLNLIFTRLDKNEFQVIVHRAKYPVDPLTGLFNRKKIADESGRIRTWQDASQEEDLPITPERLAAVLFLDLNYLKDANDTLGNIYGDAYILAVTVANLVASGEVANLKDNVAINHFISEDCSDYPDLQQIFRLFQQPDFWGPEFQQLSPRLTHLNRKRVSEFVVRYGGDEIVMCLALQDKTELAEMVRLLRAAFKVIDNQHFKVLPKGELKPDGTRTLSKPKSFPHVDVAIGGLLTDGKQVSALDPKKLETLSNIEDVPFKDLASLFDVAFALMKKNKSAIKDANKSWTKRGKDDRRREPEQRVTLLYTLRELGIHAFTLIQMLGKDVAPIDGDLVTRT